MKQLQLQNIEFVSVDVSVAALLGHVVWRVVEVDVCGAAGCGAALPGGWRIQAAGGRQLPRQTTTNGTIDGKLCTVSYYYINLISKYYTS